MAVDDAAAGRPWHYLVVTDTCDEADYRRRVRDAGEGVYLTRTAPDRSAEQYLHPDGTWHAGDRLTRMSLRGELFWTHDLTLEQARDVARRWSAAGKIAGTPGVERDLPADLAAVVADREAVDERARGLRDAGPGATLDADTVRQACATLLDGATDVSPAWLGGPGRVAVPAFAAWPVDPEDVERLTTALRRHADTVWVLLVGADEWVAATGTPHGRAVAADPLSVRAALGVLGSYRPRLLTTPALDCAVLGGDDYDVAAGPPDVVEAALGCDLVQARAQFLRFARGEHYFPPARDLAEVLERYHVTEDAT